MCERLSKCSKIEDFQLTTFHKSFDNPSVSYIMWIKFVSYYNNAQTTVKIMQKLQMFVSRVTSDGIVRSR